MGRFRGDIAYSEGMGSGKQLTKEKTMEYDKQTLVAKINKLTERMLDPECTDESYYRYGIGRRFAIKLLNEKCK